MKLRAFEWNTVLATGIPVVDEQHQRLLEIFNEALIAQAEGASAELTTNLLESLFDYTRYHFREEAQLMRKWAVDEAQRATHLEAHERFIAFLKQTRGLAVRHPAVFTADLLGFLARWLLHHIMGLDASMARAIRARQGELAPASEAAPHEKDEAQQYLFDIMGQLTDELGQRTFDLLDQRDRLLDLQELYRAMLRSADTLIRSHDEAEMLESLCATLTQDTPFHTAWIGRPGTSQIFDTLALAGSGGQQVRDAPPRLGAGPETSIIARAWDAQQVVVCNDPQADAGLRPWHEGFAAHGWASLLAAPILRGSDPWAVLVFVSGRGRAFEEGAVALCTSIVQLIGHGLDAYDRKSELQRLQTEESQRARSDALTGLPNRLALEEHLPGALARAERRGDVVAVGMIDLDDFKPVNDRFGHAAGDVLLQKLAQALRIRMRRGDFLARLGGDELVVVFENLDADHHAAQLGMALQRLHGAVQEPFDLGDGRSAQVGMTMGLARYPRDATDPDTLLRLADVAMYANKRQKHDRAQWWYLGSDDGDDGAAEENVREETIEPFGDDASFWLQSLDAHLFDEIGNAFATVFYDELWKHAEHSRILRCLDEAEFEHLKTMQVEHLRFLLQPGTTRDEVLAKADRVGVAHALIGISSSAMFTSMGLYEDTVRRIFESALITSRQRYRCMHVLSGRLRLDMLTQMEAMKQVRALYYAPLEAPAPAPAIWADAVTAKLQSLSELPGIRHAILFLPDEKGVMHDVAGAGVDYAGISQAVKEQDLYARLNDASDAISPTAWFTHEIQVVDGFQREMRLANRHGLARMAGWRSAAAIPIGTDSGTHFVLMLYGAYPHQFSAYWARSWLDLLRARLDTQFVSSRQGTDSLDPSKVSGFRQLLYANRLQMWVQPIVDLHSGVTVKVEALARLVDEDGQVFSPAQFLSAFGAQELNTLFVQGLGRALQQLHDWREAGLDIGVTVNLSPSTLAHPHCLGWIEQALRDAQVMPEHLTLEILETEELDRTESDVALRAIDALGIRLALDDLGAGYGSLRRLAALPIDTVKIDQSLIRELPKDPVKIIRLLAALVRVGQQFARNAVVIEGLENPGYCEVARLLGAHLGQGFGIARPMPAETFLGWVRSASVAPADAELHTWPGALAYHWTTMHDEWGPRHPLPLESCPLTRFLQAQGIDDPQTLRWHDQMHHGSHTNQSEKAAEAAEAAEALLQWLANRVREGVAAA